MAGSARGCWGWGCLGGVGGGCGVQTPPAWGQPVPPGVPPLWGPPRDPVVPPVLPTCWVRAQGAAVPDQGIMPREPSASASSSPLCPPLRLLPAPRFSPFFLAPPRPPEQLQPSCTASLPAFRGEEPLSQFSSGFPWQLPFSFPQQAGSRREPLAGTRRRAGGERARRDPGAHPAKGRDIPKGGRGELSPPRASLGTAGDRAPSPGHLFPSSPAAGVGVALLGDPSSPHSVAPQSPPMLGVTLGKSKVVRKEAAEACPVRPVPWHRAPRGRLCFFHA